MFSGLSLNQAPPIRVPYKMMLSAPLFGAFAALLLLIFGYGDIDRYSPLVVAIAHLLFIGFAGFVMIGALYQMLPVVVGVVFVHQVLISKIVYLFLSLGLLFFVLKFILEINLFGLLASLFLLIGFLVFACAALFSIYKKALSSATATAIFFSLFFLVIGVSLGAHLLASNSLMNIESSYYRVLGGHIFTLLFGWILLLVVGISFQVVPMFWVSKEYSKFCKNFIVPLIIATTTLFFISSIFDIAYKEILYIGIYIALLAFGISTLKRLHERKRKHFDIVVLCWQVAISFLILSALLFLVDSFSEYDFLLISGFFFSFGFLSTLIMGMLYKIVPFLAWFHLNSKGVFDAPMLNEMVSEKTQNIQLLTHILGILTLFVALLFSSTILVKLSSLFMFTSFLLLFVNLYGVFRIYKSLDV